MIGRPNARIDVFGGRREIREARVLRPVADDEMMEIGRLPCPVHLTAEKVYRSLNGTDCPFREETEQLDIAIIPPDLILLREFG